MKDYYRETFDDFFYIYYREDELPAKQTPHIHNEYEIMLVCSDGVACEINGSIYPVPAGALLIFNSSDLHRIILAERAVYTRYVLFFKPEFIAYLSTAQTQLLECFYNRLAEVPWILPLGEVEYKKICWLMEQMLSVKNADKTAYGNDLLLRIRLCDVLIFVNLCYRSYHGITVLGDNCGQLYEMLDYVHKHLQEKITLDSLSEQFWLNRKTCSQMFRKATGTSLGEYIAKCRIMKATDALLQGMRVEEVCEQVGFLNLSHFSRTFKKYMGVSPKRYAKQHQD